MLEIWLFLFSLCSCSSLIYINSTMSELTLSVAGRHYLLFDTISKSARLHRDLGERLYMSPLVTVSKTDQATLDKWEKLPHRQVYQSSVLYTNYAQTYATAIVCLSGSYIQTLSSRHYYTELSSC